MDFFQIAVKDLKSGGYEASPDFVVGRSEDLMVRAKNFYAIWDEEKDGGMWSTDAYDVQRIVDAKLRKYAEENKDVVKVKYMRSFGSNGQSTFNKYMREIGDNSHQLDERLTFQGDVVVKKDYVSKRLPYALASGDISAWDRLAGQLYAPAEREKIEWFIGSIVSGDSKKNQKFLVLYGPPGSGKGTIIDFCLKLFDGYATTFDAKSLGSGNNQFAAAAFENNPILAVQHDGDLSRIEDNTLLNQIVSHEVFKINQKFKPAYDVRLNAALIMGTNKAVKITDAQSGLIRRLIDVHLTGDRIAPNEYQKLKAQVDFELGAIAHHCLKVYKKLGKNYYSNYQPKQMMYETDIFFNFIEAHYEIFEEQNGTSAKNAWRMYNEYCEEAKVAKGMQFPRFRAELAQYFEKFHDRKIVNGTQVRSYFEGFKAQPFKTPVDDDITKFTLRMDETISLLNLELAEYPAQYAKADGSPSKYWDDSERQIGKELKRPRPSQIVDTLLQDLDPYLEHYVKTPENMVVIDFDLRDADGNKSLVLNLEAAALWPATYGELSKSGQGVHLHYYYHGDIERLDPNYAPGIEVKRYSGNGALRRKLTRCNDVPIADINSGLPLKEQKRVLDQGSFKSQKSLREFIAKNLRKEYHPGTKSSIDFIKKGLDDAYEDGLSYDVSDLRQKITIFANNSSNQALNSLKVVQSMRWKSEEDIDENLPEPVAKDPRLVIYDVEVYPNLFVVCWKFKEEPGVKPSADNVVTMINPTADAINGLMELNLVGFNVKGYDNHILWAAAMGYNNEALYKLSKKIIDNVKGVKFGSAYNISHTDIYDFSTDKMSLKKWQVKLGLEHREMDLPWDEPVADDDIPRVVEYCANDVVSTEEVLNHLQGDYKARLILAELADLKPNESTARLTAAIVFGKEKNPQRSFVYTDLRKDFPGYEFTLGKSTYRGEDVGEGGYVYSEPGLYQNVVLLDVASMHPTSIGQLNLFGEFTPKFMALVEAQLALKNFDFNTAKMVLDGKLRPYIEEIEALGGVHGSKDDSTPEAVKAAADLRWGLKIAINIVYGLTSAKFDNPFKHRLNVDNIVAKRGALFMINLKGYIQDVLKKKVVHIKTDSVKVPDASADDIRKIQEFGEKYGYSFDVEAIYDKLGLVNDAVYVAKHPKKGWSATGAQYQEPYVFKRLFGLDDKIGFEDVCVVKSVKDSAIYLDFGAHYFANLSQNNDIYIPGAGYIDYAVFWQKGAAKSMKMAEKTGVTHDIQMAEKLIEEANNGYNDALAKLIFVGKIGKFVPVKEGYGGGQIWRIKEGNHYAVAGTKGYLWVDANVAADLPDEAIDYSYFDKLTEEAETKLDSFLVGSPFHDLAEFLS